MPLIDYQLLTGFVSGLLRAAGAGVAAADSTARSVVSAEAAGYSSHGLTLLITYLDGILKHDINANAEPVVVYDHSSFIAVDGRNGLGPYVLDFASKLAIHRVTKDAARSNGFCGVAVYHPGHVGRLAPAVNLATSQGCLMFATCGTGLIPTKAVVAAPGGKRRILGSNPIAFGVPNGATAPFTFDFSTAASSFYRIKECADAGELLPPGVLVDWAGRPTEDPEDFFEGGALQPSAGYKGFAISLACLMLAGLAVGPPGVERAQPPSIDGLFLFAGNLSTWNQWADYQAKITSFLRELKVELSAHGPESTRLPGEQSWARENTAIANGVPVRVEVLDVLRKTANRLSVFFPWNVSPQATRRKPPADP